MDKIRIIARICGISLRRLVGSPRFYVAFIWISCLFSVFAKAIRRFCMVAEINTSPWMFPFLTNDSGNQMFIILGALLLFCDAPFLDVNSGWQMLRSGRKNWFWGKIIFIWISALLYTLILSLLPILMTFPYVNWMGGGEKYWGVLLRQVLLFSLV